MAWRRSGIYASHGLNELKYVIISSDALDPPTLFTFIMDTLFVDQRNQKPQESIM